MLGLFNVDMPLLEGEGQKVFMRFQRETIQNSDDESIFARGLNEEPLHSNTLRALQPRLFQYSGDVRAARLVDKLPYAITNQGLRFDLNLSRKQHTSVKDATVGTKFVINLNCHEERPSPRSSKKAIEIVLTKFRGEPQKFWGRDICRTDDDFECDVAETEVAEEDEEKISVAFYIR
jgi:hypothetical protein